jgi:3-oxoacyl-[acyl-carrier protein] reductase
MAALPAYAMSKIPANSLTLSLAAALGSRQITVNALLPGFVETDMTTALRDNEAAMQHIVAQTALGRVGQPQDIANAVSLLVSPKGAWISGQLIEVAGGARL